jgi:hypothetical protein
VNEISAAYEETYDKQISGAIDNKTSDTINTTLKGLTYLNVKLKMDYQKMMLQAAIKKVDLPKGLLPELENPEN